MGHVVRLIDGHLVYDGMLSSKEIASINEILNALKEEIPKVENDLQEEYGTNVWYKYYLGVFLSDLIDKYEIPVYERRWFWDEIKSFATQEERKRDEGKDSATRSFYEQCYVLSHLDKETVEKLSWRQWQSLLDRVDSREDERIFVWIKQSQEKITEEGWREFLKALHLYLKNKDTSVFENNELFEIYDSILLMCKIWSSKLKDFAKTHPKSAKIKNKSTWSKKYYALCFAKKKERRIRIVTEDICYESFSELMDY